MDRREFNRSAVRAAVAAALFPYASFGRNPRGASVAGPSWQTLPVGAGGFVRGLHVVADGTMVARTDSNGAYLYNSTRWQQLFNANSLPSAFISSTDIAVIGAGCYEIQAAPSNTNIFYASYLGFIWVSSNRGATWTQTAFTQNLAGMQPNDSFAQYGQRMAIDPQNSNIVFVGTENNGLWLTINGGISWTQVSTASVPVGTGAGISGILFDPSSSVVSGAKQGIYACSNGNGVYHSTNGGATWTLTSSGPTGVLYAAIDTSGNYYAINGTGVQNGSSLMKYSGTWATTAAPSNSNALQAVAINPFNINEVVVVISFGYIAVSYDAGVTWTTYTEPTAAVSSPDIPWLAQGNTTSPGFISLDAGGLAFSPVTNGLLIQSAGTGMWSTPVPASGFTSTTPYTWTDFSVGIEQLVANAILIPPGGTPILASWDRPFFNITSLTNYPSTYGPVNSDVIQMGWSIDYASSSPSFVAGVSDFNGEHSGYTTNNGVSWTAFSSFPPGYGTSAIGGVIAASTPQNIIWGSEGSNPYYTLNQGATWTAIAISGISNWSGFQHAYFFKQRSITADRVTANTFYLYFPGNGVYKSSDGGATWTQQLSGYIESNSSLAGINSWLMSVPGNAGHLFYTSGNVGGQTPSSGGTEPFYRSTNAGVTWTAVSGVNGVQCFSFGAIAPGKTYPSIYIVGYVAGVYGVFFSTDNAVTWTSIGNPNSALQALSLVCCIAADPNNFGRVYVGTPGGGYMYYG